MEPSSQFSAGHSSLLPESQTVSLSVHCFLGRVSPMPSCRKSFLNWCLPSVDSGPWRNHLTAPCTISQNSCTFLIFPNFAVNFLLILSWDHLFQFRCGSSCNQGWLSPRLSSLGASNLLQSIITKTCRSKANKKLEGISSKNIFPFSHITK